MDNDLDSRMKEAGMMPVSVMLEQNAFGKFSAHAGVTDLDKFEEWIQMRRKEFITMQARMTLDDQEGDEMFEWVVAHVAVLGEVMANFRQATAKTHSSVTKGIQEMHELKIEPVYFEQVSTGYKTFEIRKDDRGYQKGDKIMLREFDQNRGVIESQRYTGRAIIADIGYVTAYEQQKGYVVFSLLGIEEKDVK